MPFGCRHSLSSVIQGSSYRLVSSHLAHSSNIVSLLSLPLPYPPLPIIELHNPIPPPILTGAPLFIAAVKNLREPWLLPDVPTGSLVAFTTFSSSFLSDSDTGKPIVEVRYVGVGRVVAEGGMRGAVERRKQVLDEGVDKDEGRFCDVLCIIGDQYVSNWSLCPPLPPYLNSQPTSTNRELMSVYGNPARNRNCNLSNLPLQFRLSHPTPTRHVR